MQIAIKPTKALQAELVLLEEFFLVQQKPLTFNPYAAENVIMEGERTFEAVCITMQEAGMHNAKEMTEYEFYSTILYFQKKYENMK